MICFKIDRVWQGLWFLILQNVSSSFLFFCESLMMRPSFDVCNSKPCTYSRYYKKLLLAWTDFCKFWLCRKLYKGLKNNSVFPWTFYSRTNSCQRNFIELYNIIQSWTYLTIGNLITSNKMGDIMTCWIYLQMLLYRICLIPIFRLRVRFFQKIQRKRFYWLRQI